MPQNFKMMQLLRKRAAYKTCSGCGSFKRVLGNVCRGCRTNSEGTHARDLRRTIAGSIARRNPRYA